jgi:hypothetical protein
MSWSVDVPNSCAVPNGCAPDVTPPLHMFLFFPSLCYPPPPPHLPGGFIPSTRFDCLFDFGGINIRWLATSPVSGGGDGTHTVVFTSDSFFHFVLFFASSTIFVRGAHTPRMALGVESFLCSGLARRGGGQFPLSLSTYLFGVNGRINENKSINHYLTSFANLADIVHNTIILQPAL